MLDTVVTLTSKSVEQILAAGGSKSWKLRQSNARGATYLVCARNGKSKNAGGKEPHRSGFLIGRISGIVQSPDREDRYLIQISEWARIDKPELWAFGRNPVHYANLSDLGIDPTKIKFERVPKTSPQVSPAKPERSADVFTLQGFKRGLAANLGVPVDAIEITIRA